MFSKDYVLLGAIALLAIVSISIVWQLFSANYPTHSDVFFLGVEAGVLGVVLLVCLVLIGILLYRLIIVANRIDNVKKHATEVGIPANVFEPKQQKVFAVREQAHMQDLAEGMETKGKRAKSCREI
jgi:uncharacterized membrane protein